jgi:hypothetical protein
MTELDWQACTEPSLMLELLGNKPRRKLKLFGCACLRRIWHLLTDLRCKQLVEVAEKDADGRAQHRELADVIRQAKGRNLRDAAGRFGLFAFWALRDWMECPGPHAWHHTKAMKLAHYAANAIAHQLYYSNRENSDEVAMNSPVWIATSAAEWVTQCTMLRGIFGNPFRPISSNPSWLTPTVLGLAEAAYDNRNLPAGTLDNSRLAVLADALEDAGCDNADILNHLRQPGEHVRGCWLLDLLLGKE